MRRTSLAAIEALFDWMRAGVGPDGALAAFERALLERHRDDRERFAEIFEPSVSVDAEVHRYRLSYSFPGHRADPSARDALLAMAAPFGRARETFARLLAGAADERVSHVLFGLAWDGAARFRAKLYFQLADAAPPAARAAFAARVLSVQPAALPPGPVHLLAVDHGALGVTGARVYVERAPVEGARLGDARLGPLREALDVHRMTGPGGVGAAPSDVDFGLAASGRTWPELRGAPALRALAEALAPPVPFAVRRVSVGEGGRATAYFVVTAEEP